jgi:riboflavin kinase/FMN adenylyltransferase
MILIEDLRNLKKPIRNVVLTIGNFDGVHRGHLALFGKVKERAKVVRGQSAVMTFEPHPVRIMKPGNGPRLITPTSSKTRTDRQSRHRGSLCLRSIRNSAISARDFVKASRG